MESVRDTAGVEKRLVSLDGKGLSELSVGGAKLYPEPPGWVKGRPVSGIIA